MIKNGENVWTILRKTYFTLAVVQPFVVAMADEHGEHILTLTMQDIVDSIVTGDVLKNGIPRP